MTPKPDDYVDNFDDLDEPDDPLQEALDGCGRLPDGTCMLAGTEFCDWDCPFSD